MSRDGNVRIASAGSDQTIRIWDPGTGTAIGGPLTGHSAVISALVTWEDIGGETRLGSASEDGTVRIWDTVTGAPYGPALVGHAGWVEALTSWRTATGQPRLASAGVDGTIRVWDPESGDLVGEPWTGHTGAVWALASWAAPDGTVRVASGGDDRTVRIWDAQEGQPHGVALVGHSSAVWALATWRGPDGNLRLASGSFDGAIETWEVESGQRRHSLLGHSSAVKVMSSWTSSAGARLISASTDGSARIWDPESGKAVGKPFSRPAGGEAPALAVWTTAAGKASVASPADGDKVQIWDPDDGTITSELATGHIAGIWALEILTNRDDGLMLASAGGDRTIRLWNVDTGRPIGSPFLGHTAGLWALTSWQTADGAPRLASAGDDRTIRTWDPTTGEAVGSPLPGHTGWIPALISWTDPGDGGTVLASAGDDATIRLWDAQTGAAIGQPLASPGSWVLSLCAWTQPDGGVRLASGHDDGTIQLWDLATGLSLATMNGHSNWVRSLTTFVDSAGRRLLASCGYDGTMRRWDPERGAAVGDPVTVGKGQVGSVTSWVTGDGSARIATGNAEAVIQVWDGDTAEPVGEPLTGHTAGIWALTSWVDPASGATRLASSGYDGTVRLWDADGGFAIRTIEVGPVTMWAMSDAPADVDLLGREALADAIAAQLNPMTDRDEDVAGPAVVSVEGSWGCGKSTLMELIRDRMPPHSGASARSTAGRLTVRQAARLIRGRSTDETGGRPEPTTRRGVVTAWFNPWAHQSGEQVWAGLANEIIEAVAPVLYPTEESRERYWLVRNLDRIDRFALERMMYRRIISPILGIALIAVAVPLAIALTQLNTPIELFGLAIRTATVALAAGLAVFIAGILHTVARYGFGRAARYLPSELLHAPMAAAAGSPLASGDAEQIVDPLRRASAGSLYLHQHDIGALLQDLNQTGHHLVVFIDDLDRCRASTTAEVFEAVNLFLSSLTASKGLRAQFVIGVDPVVIAGHLDEYANRRDPAALQLGEDPSPGWAFLRKLVQLPVVVPSVRDSGLRAFIDSATGGPGQLPRARAGGAVARQPSPPTAGGAPTPASASATTPSWPATPSAVRSGGPPSLPVTTVAWRMLEQHPELKELFVERLAAQPDRSVREAKRLLNTWQFFARLLSAVDPVADPAAALARGKRLVILAEIVTRWPALQKHLHALMDGECGLSLLAAQFDDDSGWNNAVARLEIELPANQRAMESLRRLLRDYEAEQLGVLAARLF